MRLLDRYLLRQLLLPLAYCLGAFLVSFIAFDLMSNIADFHEKNLTVGDIFEYYLDRTPEFLVANYVTPMSLLLAMLYALTNHARHNELTAMRAAAIPLGRIALPYFVVGTVFSLGAFYVNERLLPDGVEAAERVLRRHASDQSKEADKAWRRNFFFVNSLVNRTWRIGAYHSQAGLMVQPQFNWQRTDGTRLRVSAEGARWLGNRWLFTNAEQMEFSAVLGAPPLIRSNAVLTIPALTETPRIIKSEIKISAIGDNFRSMRRVQLSSAEILDYLKLHPRLDRVRSNSLRTLLHKRLAEPWICFVVVLIAVPFGALPGRRNVFVGVASSVFICFTFFILKDLTLALGSRGLVPPWLAGWMPNLIFATTGLVLIRRVR